MVFNLLDGKDTVIFLCISTKDIKYMCLLSVACLNGDYV